MTDKIKELITVLLIQLVLTIPFYTANVYATINTISVKGSNGIAGFARQNDFLTFNVQAVIAGDAITNEQITLGSNIQFDKCVPSVSSGYDCTLRFPGNGTQTFEVKALPLTINLFKDDKTIDDTKSGNVTIDNKPPQVSLSAGQKFSSQENVVVNYDVTDFACDDISCSNTCVGLKNIQFFTLDGSFSQTIDINTNDCNAKSSISIEPKTFNDGLNSVFAKATDKFGQVSEEQSVTFEVDATPPNIITNSFAVSSKGVPLNTFSQNPVPVAVSVNISGSDLDYSSVTADLSALNPSQNLNDVQAVCQSAYSGLSVCTWSITLNPQSGGSKTVTINALDTSGNKVSATITKFLSIDDRGPVVQSLSTAATIGAQSVAKPQGNTVVAVFDEGTGLNANDIFLHIGNYKISATSCGKELSWMCKWENVYLGGLGASPKISVQSDSADVLGNAAFSSSVAVSVDSTPPVLKNINISPVGGAVQAFPGFFKLGDKISVVANLTEANDVFATADFSKFVSGAKNVAGSCQKTSGDERICTWLTDSINLQSNDVITFNFSDNAGNVLIVTSALKTYGVENATVPDFWSNTFECSPKSIDRSLGPLINQRIFCQVSLASKPNAQSVSTVFIGTASCTGDTSIVESVDTFSTEAGSKSPVVKITLRKDEFKIDNAKLTCSFNVFSKIGSGSDITKNPEVESITVNVPFFNLPLGEVSQEVQRKIDDAKKDAKGIFKLIGTLNKLSNYAKKICQIFGVIYNILAVLATITMIFKTTTDTTCFAFGGYIAPVCAFAYKYGVKFCEVQTAGEVSANERFRLTGNTFCKIVNCQEAFLWGNLVKDWINKGKFVGIEAIDKVVNPGQYVGPKTDFSAGKTDSTQLTTYDHVKQISVGLGGQARPVSEYMDPHHNLIVALMFECIPGIIYGLDKYRQIQCLYADCLENAVAKDGIPVTACEDQKSYAKCKYVTGELFALIPLTAIFDHFVNIIKNALSNPFSALGTVASAICWWTCPVPPPAGAKTYHACALVKLFSTMGLVIGNVKNIIDEGFKIRQDYCSRIDLGDKTTSTDTTTQKTSQGSGVLGIPKK